MWTKRIIFALFYLTFSSAIVFGLIGYKSKGLVGGPPIPSKPGFSKQAFLTAEYQDLYTEYLRTNNPFFNDLIRINNQYRYSCFNAINIGGHILGKNNQIFDIDRIKATYGAELMNEADWGYYMPMLDFVSDTLRKLNKPILLVNVGEKARIMEECIPDELRKPQTNKTNYNQYLQKFKNENRISFIDLVPYFLHVKDTGDIELYPPYSTHWSNYSVYLTADSLAKKVNTLLPQYETVVPVLDGFYVTKDEGDIEYEMLRYMNTYWAFSKPYNHYPIVKFNKKTTKRKPRAFVIGDSFGQMLTDFGYLYDAFDDSSVFVRYNAEYKHKSTQNRLISIYDNFDYWKEFDNCDVVIILTSEINLNNFGLTFFERAYDHFKGIDNFIESYQPLCVARAEVDNNYLYSIKKGTKQNTYFKSRNPNVQSGKSYKLTYMAKGKGELSLDFYPDFLPQTLHTYDSDNWKQYTWEFTMPEYQNIQVVMFRMYLDSQRETANDMQFKNFKLVEVK